MTGIILAVCVLTTPPSQTDASDTPPSVSRVDIPAVTAPERSLKEWRDAVSQALKAQASAQPVDQPTAVMKLVQLYRELLVARQLNSGEEKRLRMLVRGRLLRLRDEIPQDLRMRVARVHSAEAKAEREKQPVAVHKIKDDQAVLAQWRGVLAQPPFAQGAGGNQGGLANRDDDGQELADLIQAVITPDFWETNGGPGAIVYFKSLHVLVVRATTETHENVADLLDALRRAGN